MYSSTRDRRSDHYTPVASSGDSDPSAAERPSRGLCPLPSPDREHDYPSLTITSLVRLAVDEHGRGPSPGAIRTYVADGLIKPGRDSSGRLLFRQSDAKLALQIYVARTARHGAVGRRQTKPAS